MTAEELLDLRRQFHRIPEIGFKEMKTQQLILDVLEPLVQENWDIKLWRTGVLVFIKGSDPSQTLAYRTDIDGLPIEERSGIEDFVSEHKGMMHACGHDFHMTIALGVLSHLSKHRPTDHVLFVFQPAEEGPGGAKPMLEEGVLKEWWPDQIVALHIAPELPVGTVSTREGLLFANTSELFIDLKGKGGHAAYPHTARDMVVAASHFVTQLQTIVARNVNPLDSGVVTIGVIKGGTKQNIIAESARVEGTIRSLSIESMTEIKRRIEAMAKGIEASFECELTIDYGSNYCQVNNHSELTQEYMAFAERDPDVTFVEAPAAMTGEDFGYFLEQIPGFMFWLGVDSPYGLHDARLNPDEAAIEKAVTHLISYFTWKMKK
ncbi:N-acetyldiaminopimelate deacetylase [Alkalicoccobacillus murimartini]|uniref:N-acetyldiaminopimelate deacetylase n=1 Tax=Alkalicoccobacillus murimartini TaxID=171685 RepID=A0ABT9YF87_9BACI|nr:N-acetyldiaminopimelate deacetylase [Alkalicoccobacillus murimartini]MDQ0206513.1 N-acetyldiaminopimelate deacetylase [Alkalicoccobacillus murimartini]